MRSVLSASRAPRENRSPRGWLVGGVLLLTTVLLASGLTTAAPSSPAALSTTSPTEGWYHLPAHGTVPSTRDSGALAYDAHDGYALLFGGCRPKTCPLADTWKFQAGLWTNLTLALAVAPSPRSGAAMAYDAHDGSIILFGGDSATGAVNDTWSFANGAWAPITIHGAAPSARFGAVLTFDAATQSLILFGGTGASGQPLGDTWSYEGGIWSYLSASMTVNPPARANAGIAYDAADSVVVVFGGSGACGLYCNDTWTLSADRWANISATAGTAPGARSSFAMSYDTGRQIVLLFGGLNGAMLGDTWGFSHDTWTYLAGNSTTSPGTRVSAGATYDTADGYLLLFGGHSPSSTSGGTWAYLNPLAAVVALQLGAVTPGQADTFSVTPSGGLAPYNVSWNFGDGSAIVVGASAGHTFQSPGTFVVTVTITDGLGVTASAAATVVVAPPPIAVSLAVSPTSPRSGQTVTMTATATGGVGPFSYQWSGDVTGCTSSVGSSLTCVVSAAGTFTVSVTVTDASGHSATASQAFTVTAAPGALAPTGAASPGATASGLSTWFTSAYVTAAILIACAVGVMTYRVGRRREALRREALRPLCYAVPAWSETPTEYEPDALPPPEPWDRP